MEPIICTSITNLSTELSTGLNRLRQDQLSKADWQNERLNYVPLRGSWFANSETDFDLDEEIDNFLTHKDKKVLLLLGNSGSGKSLYTQGLVNKLWQSYSHQSPIPIWISLPSLKGPVHHAIEKTLSGYGFTAEQIQELRKTRSFIFILDAYDEIRKLKNIYITNKLEQWNAKIIFTCRSEYLYYIDNYKIYFTPFQNEKAQHRLYDEIVVRPFNVNQIQTYVTQYIKSQDVSWKESEKYQKAIDEIAGIKELIKTPFMLKLTMQVLPQIVEKYTEENVINKKRITQAALYDVFIEQWFIRQELKLKQAKRIKSDEDIKPEFWKYAKDLAEAMHVRNITQVYYDGSEESDIFDEVQIDNPWKKYFNPRNPRTALLQTACLIREMNPHYYAFTHASLIEYFLTRKLFDNLLKPREPAENNNKHNELKPPAKLENQEGLEVFGANKITVTPTISSISEQKSETISNISTNQDYFNLKLITQEANTLQFLADRVEEREEYKEMLFEKIYSSRNNPDNKIAAANAITILNRARVSFSGMDLSSIHIQGADLSYGIFHETNFENSDLQKVSFMQTYLGSANLRGCNMSDVYFGQLPCLEFRSSIHALSYSHNGYYLAISNDKDVIIWDHNNYKLYASYTKHTQYVTTLAFSMDDTMLASGSYDKTVCIWNCCSSELIGSPLLHENKILHVVFGTNPMTLISCSRDKQNDNHIYYFWDLATHTLLHTVAGSGGGIIALSKNGKLLANRISYSSNQSDNFNWIDLESRQNIGKLNKIKDYWDRSCEARNTCITFSGDNKLLATTYYDISRTPGHIELWEVVSQQHLYTLGGHKKTIKCLSFNNDSTILAGGSEDNEIYLWDIHKRELLNTTLSGHISPIISLAFNKEDVLASGCRDGIVRLWDIKFIGRIPSQSQGAHADKITRVAFMRDRNLLASSSLDETILLWDIQKLKVFGRLQNGHSGPITYQKLYTDDNRLQSGILDCSFNPDGNLLASAGKDDTVRIWDTNTQQLIGDPLEHSLDFEISGQMNAVTFSPDGTKVATGAVDGTQLYDVLTQKPIGAPFLFFTDPIENFKMIEQVLCLAFSFNGKLLVSGFSNAMLAFWDVSQYQMASSSVVCDAEIIHSVAFHIDFNNNDNVTDNSNFAIWDNTHKKVHIIYQGHTDAVNSIMFNADSSLLVSGGGDKSICIWETSTKKLHAKLQGHCGAVTSVAFNPDGKTIASASNDKTVRLWDAITQTCLHIVYYGLHAINSVRFNSDGSYLALAVGSNIAILKRSLIDEMSYAYYLASTTSSSLIVNGLKLDSMQKLSENNRRLLIQFGVFVQPSSELQIQSSAQFIENHSKVHEQVVSTLTDFSDKSSQLNLEKDSKKTVFPSIREIPVTLFARPKISVATESEQNKKENVKDLPLLLDIGP